MLLKEKMANKAKNKEKNNQNLIELKKVENSTFRKKIEYKSAELEKSEFFLYFVGKIS
jgi:hypothetical protein